jgi:glycosyltransferase involved in cell wall biosynthesis
MTPKISVLMPVYNIMPTSAGSFLLANAVESIIAQDFEDWEMIIANDGSKDSTLEAAHAMAKLDKRIRVIDLPHQGLGGVINSAAAEARGEYLARMDGDDMSVVYRFSVQNEILDKNPEIGITGSGMWVINTDGHIIMEIVRPSEHDDIIRFAIQFGSPFVHGTVMMRRKIFEEVGRYRPGFATEDFDLWFRMLSATRGYNFPEPMYVYRQHHSSYSFTRAKEIAEATADVHDRFVKRFSHLAPYHNEKALS